jgi:hypothetical protein
MTLHKTVGAASFSGNVVKFSTGIFVHKYDVNVTQGKFIFEKDKFSPTGDRSLPARNLPKQSHIRHYVSQLTYSSSDGNSS